MSNLTLDLFHFYIWELRWQRNHQLEFALESHGFALPNASLRTSSQSTPPAGSKHSVGRGGCEKDKTESRGTHEGLPRRGVDGASP